MVNVKGDSEKTLEDYKHVQVEDHFYTKEEYSQLSHDKCAKLWLIRSVRSKEKGSKTKKCNQKKNYNFKNYKAENEEL